MACPYSDPNMRIRDRHHRRSIRLHGYDYSQPGTYCVTLCSENMAETFGSVVDGSVKLSSLGLIVRECWLEIPHHITRAELDELVIMPNHLHGIIVLKEVGARHGVRVPPDVGARHGALLSDELYLREGFGRPAAGSLATIIRLFKQAVTVRSKVRCGNSRRIWQRNFYEHIVRDFDELEKARNYVRQNPLRWACDRYNSKRGVLVLNETGSLVPWE
jgi:putative transposase